MCRRLHDKIIPFFIKLLQAVQKDYEFYISNQEISDQIYNNIISDPIRLISYSNKWLTVTVDAQLSSSSKF